MSAPFPIDSVPEFLKRRLFDAAQAWHADERRRAWRATGRRRTFLSAAAVTGLVAIEIAVGRLTGWPVGGSVVATAAVGGAAIGVTASRALLGRRTPVWSDVAERLDQAASDHNCIATALEFCRDGHRSAFAVRAIRDGLNAATRFADLSPVAAHAHPVSRSGWGWCVAAVLAVVAASVVRLPSRVSVAFSDRVDRPATSRADDTSPTQRSLNTPVAKPRAPTGSPPASGVRQARTPSPERGAASAAASSQAALSSAAMPATSGEAQAGVNDTSNRPSRPEADQNAGPTAQTESRSSGRAEASGHASNAGRSTLGDATVMSASGGDGDDQANNADPAAAASSGVAAAEARSERSTASSPQGTNEEAGERQGNAGKTATRGGNGSNSSPNAGGNGQSGGQGGQKKSRGVAPLLLGIAQPDLLTGTPQPGPERRTQTEVPPEASPQPPDRAAPTADRQGGESAVDVYRVPPAASPLVGRYFQQLHRDAARPPG